ncbi:hypothetical protein CDD81_1743 [Ophiocordyceps australis]|uniref:BZIP domain-containing protein n=1 Tax=Ophiocordyceps australis TaxID=1399860 RepID=A0A2C5YAC2_9HYPO|nr:hypothetical protein CDD81_1743 [Ophiocordyceps australis]
MAGEKSGGSGSASASAIRIRENQRRSRARRKEYVESMERKVQEYERRGVEATLEMQQAARTVAVENARLRMMLAQRGASSSDIDAFLQAFQDHDAARTLSLVRWQGAAGGPRPWLDVDTKSRPVSHDCHGHHNQHECPHSRHCCCEPHAGRQARDASLPGLDSDTTDQESQSMVPRCHATDSHSLLDTAMHYGGLPSPWNTDYALTSSPFDKLDVLAAASVQQGFSDDATQRSASRARSPSTTDPSPGAATPLSSGPRQPSIASPTEMSCNAAAQIIAEMHGCGDRDLVKDKLGCHQENECLVKKTMLFQILESHNRV